MTNKQLARMALPGYAHPASLLLLAILSIMAIGLISQSPMKNETQYQRFNQIQSDELSRLGLESMVGLLRKTGSVAGGLALDQSWVSYDVGIDSIADSNRCGFKDGLTSPKTQIEQHFLRFFTRLEQSFGGKSTMNAQYRITSCAWSESGRSSSISINSALMDFGPNGESTPTIKAFIPY